MVGLITMVYAWILFARGQVPEAEKALDDARSTLWKTDYVERANILSFEGRIARRTGNYELARKKFEAALQQFADNNNTRHPNLARTYSHMALTLFFHAKTRPLIEASKARQEGMKCLQNADDFYRRHYHGEHRGVARVHYAWSVYYESIPELAEAASRASQAHDVARKYGDLAMAAHARVMQCRCQEYSLLSLAEEADSLAATTDNRRARTRAKICLAQAQLRRDARTRAVGSIAAASELFESVQPGAPEGLADTDLDYLRDEFRDLDRRMREARAADDRICELTRSSLTQHKQKQLDGAVRFVEDEVVRLVWEENDRNQVHAASKLQISRGRLIKILKRQGLVRRNQ
jgi:tetratricopeptide (TPR) repeat protein